MPNERNTWITKNMGTTIYQDAKDKNVSAKLVYTNENGGTWHDRNCTVPYYVDELLEAVIKGALVCYIYADGESEFIMSPICVCKTVLGNIKIWCYDPVKTKGIIQLGSTTQEV